MAVKTWYVQQDLATGSNHQELSETDPGTEAFASPVTGWVVSTTAGGTAPYDAQTEQAAATFTGTHPDGSINTAGDCWRTESTYNGNFASGNWEIHFTCRQNTNPPGQGRILFRMFRSANADGSSATEITGATQTGSTVTPTTSTVDSNLTTFNPGAFSVSNEYIFFQLAWERITGGGMTSADVNMRVGNSAGAGSRVISADFTALPTSTTGAAAGTGSATATGLEIRLGPSGYDSIARLSVSRWRQPTAA